MFNHLRLASATPACSAVLLAASLIWAGAPIALGAEMTESVLPNGMRVIMRPVHTNPVVCSAVLVRAGVAWEPEGMSGASHFLEHLLFNGTETRSQEQLYADVDRIGAFQQRDDPRRPHLVFVAGPARAPGHGPRDSGRHVAALDAAPGQVREGEWGIVLEEMGRDANDPGQLADVFFDARLHAGSPYARPVLGTVESIRGLTRDAGASTTTANATCHAAWSCFSPVTSILIRYSPVSASTFSTRTPTWSRTGHWPAVSIPFDAEPKVAHHKLEAGRTYLRAAFPAPAEGDPDALAFSLPGQAAGRRWLVPAGERAEGRGRTTRVRLRAAPRYDRRSGRPGPFRHADRGTTGGACRPVGRRHHAPRRAHAGRSTRSICACCARRS